MISIEVTQDEPEPSAEVNLAVQQKNLFEVRLLDHHTSSCYYIINDVTEIYY